MSRLPVRWLITGVAFVAILLTAVVAVPSLSATATTTDVPSYLALGDSVAFGTNPLLDPSVVNPHRFIGYPTPVADGVDDPLTNAACPGETSSHFIDTSLSDNGCGTYPGPLHIAVSYTGQESQLAFALTFLAQHPSTQLITIDIGANDLFVLQRDCNGDLTCIQTGLFAPTGMLATLGQNLGTIYRAIRSTGYHGRLVALTYYSLNYSDLPATQVIGAVNQVVEQVTVGYGGKVADGFGAFHAASTTFGGDTCLAGLRIVVSTSPLTCDIHPSEAGRNVLGQAVLSALA